MDDTTRSLLEDAIAAGFADLSNFDEESKNKSMAVENLVKLYRLKIDEDRNNWDFDEKYNRRIMEDEQRKEEFEIHKKESKIKEIQMKEQKIDRWINVGIQVGLTLAGLIAYDCWYRRGLIFEETGTITSPMTRNLMSKMLPKK